MSKILDAFENGTFEEKEAVLHAFRSNLSFSGKKVSIYNAKPMSILIKTLKTLRAKNEAFEPKNYPYFSTKNGVFHAAKPALLRMLEYVRTYPEQVGISLEEGEKIQ